MTKSIAALLSTPVSRPLPMANARKSFQHGGLKGGLKGGETRLKRSLDS